MNCLRLSFLTSLLVIGAALAPAQEVEVDPAARTTVTFIVNDADEKDLVLAGVRIGLARTSNGVYEITGVTDAQGRFTTPAATGTWYVTYKLPNYVPIDHTETTLRGPEDTLTTTLSLALEASGEEVAQRIRIILNWGMRQEQVRDADSHLWCACQDPQGHVSYQNTRHARDTHGVELDVDDRDWGGPETITLINPPPGEYVYWVHNFSGPPATLADSEAIVRVLFDDAVAAEYRVIPGADQAVWRPFKTLVVDPILGARLIPYTPAELATDLPLQPPALPASAPPAIPNLPARGEQGCGAGCFLCPFFIVLPLFLFSRKKKK